MSSASSDPSTPWYRDGLRFECTRCGNCCTGQPGFVWVVVEEIDALANHFGMTRDQFSSRYVRRVGNRLSLLERPGGDCILWDKQQGCTAYEARPIQCRTWPFWPENIATPEDWDHVRSVCPGSGKGQLFPIEIIEAEAARVHPDE